MRAAWRPSCWVMIILTGGCAQLQPRPDFPDETAIALGEDTPLDRATAAVEGRHPGQSAFRLVAEGTEAFASRMRSARMAMRSLDIQMYIWHADLTGMYFTQEVLAAADRGVKVRMLLDDMDARRHHDANAALAAHPNIEVRAFNPFASRHGALGLIGEGLTRFGRINRRMHNKSWVADNRIAIVGGRNIGDEYFGASDEMNFVDLDLAMIGPVVRGVSASFDEYWNSPLAYPMEVLDSEAVNAVTLERLRDVLAAHLRESRNSRYAAALRGDDAIRRMLEGDWPMQWAGTYRFISDDPSKVTMRKRDAKRAHVGSALAPMVEATRERLSIVSPYFVPGNKVTEMLAGAARSAKRVRVLTNSLIANDVAAVHGGYSRYRKPLLRSGVQIWELKPTGGDEVASSLFGSSGASLHTKAFAVDGTMLFVGSYNLDPRSTWLNCEQGVLVENAVLTSQFDAIFARHTAGDLAWQVTLEGGALRWSDGREQFDSDPHASMFRRLQAWLFRVLRLEAQL